MSAFPCPECQKVMSCECEYAWHVAIEHSAMDWDSGTCRHCGESIGENTIESGIRHLKERDTGTHITLSGIARL